MSAEVIHIAGRYNKYRRDLSQSPWLDKDDVRIKNSVQEIIQESLAKFITYESASFASCGREDVDVRMLGRGRPFVFKIHNATDRDNVNELTMRQIENHINKEHGKEIRVRDLQLVSKSSVSKHLNEGQQFKSKEYRALCCSSRKLSKDEIERLNEKTVLQLQQKTPIRVLHRRTLATRNRMIHKLRVDPVSLGDYECVRPADLDYVFALTLVTEAGTYIKEFVHGDFGRTLPNLSSLIGADCETDLIELDVMEVHVDWPPTLDYPDNPISGPMEEIPLAELYSKALKSMQDAESKPRGDERQDLYLTARRMFERADEVVESLGLFSDNETIDDIATTDLKYLLVPAYLAKVNISAECTPNLLETFLRAQKLIIKFLTRISAYGLGNDRIKDAIKSEESIHEPSQQGPLDVRAAIQNRNEKIEKFQQMKLLESKLEELERKLGTDDEISREYYLKLIDKWIEESLESLEREVRPAIFLERNRSTVPIVKERPEPAGISTSAANYGRPFTIVKDDLQKLVYGSGYPSRPTVTVDEFITKKITDGDLAFQVHKEVYSNSLQRYAEDPGLRRDQEEKSDEERDAKEDCDDEEELARKRRWDEFKDENPRGSGNRHNMG